MEILSVAAFIGGSIFSAIASSRLDAQSSQEQQDILKRGQQAQGRIVKVWRPPLMGSFPRIYFEFQPEGGATLHCCHIDRRSLEGFQVSLPAVGTCVSIRYLPEKPGRAVIAKLVSRMRR